MSVLSKMNTPAIRRNGLVLMSSMGLLYYGTLKFIKSRDKKNLKTSNTEFLVSDLKNKKDKAAVNAIFFKKLYRLIKFLIPGVISAEFFFMVLVAVSLICRTLADVFMIQIGTSIESSIITGSVNSFVKNLAKYVSAMPFISLVNNSLKYGIDELKLRFRTRLSNYLYHQYLKNLTYYKMNNLDNRISNVDQLLTQDIEKFCNSLTDLYSNLSKPLLDVFIYAKKLTSAIGFEGPSIMLVYLLFSGMFLTWLRKPVVQMTVNEQLYEGEFRFVNSRLITNCEEIAFYQGHSREETNIINSFNKLVNHYRNFITFRFSMGFLDNIIAKYCATFVGYSVVSRPFLNEGGKFKNKSHSDRLEDYYKSGRMLVKMAEAIGRISLAGRELTRLAGYTQRVTQLIDVLNDINNGVYKRTMINDKNSESSTKQRKPNSGKVIYQNNTIKFDRVPLVTPNGDILIEELSFEVKSGDNVLICGPNGCGKSSLFRTLGEVGKKYFNLHFGSKINQRFFLICFSIIFMEFLKLLYLFVKLWPCFGGIITKPEKGKLFYIPQKPYMTLGTLRDQVIYPDTIENMKRKHFTDKDLSALLDKVQLQYLIEREKGFDSIQDWLDVLSGGEKQRIAMARLLYHQPQFAILDECTSAVSVDVEGYIYEYCKTVGITLFTVSHRKSLWKYHDYYLQMDGRGSYEFKTIDESTKEFGS